MKNTCFALVILAAFASTASAWNDKGHMVVARLAWKKLSADERAKILKVLEKHPHYEEFLKAKKPVNLTQDEWVFLRAATWADWVRNGPPARKKFSVPAAHFVDYPFVQAESKVAPPKLSDVNAVKWIEKNKLQATAGGSGEDVAVAVTWLFHLVGDIHQPLHCVSFYSDNFPEGDRGGNLSLVRLPGGGVIQLHRFWDGLLGTPVTLSSITGTVLEIEGLVKDHPETVKSDLETNKTPESWGKESFATAKQVAYAGGKLKPANNNDHPSGDGIPSAPADYAATAGETARFAAAKAGERLAEVLRLVASKN